MKNELSPLVSVSQAQRIVLDHVTLLPVVSVGLDSALGLTLASDIACDIDMPPFDRAMMDGFAVRAADTDESGATLTVLDHIAAGGFSQKELST